MSITEMPDAVRAARDTAAIRSDFPILKTRVHGKPLAYLDNAATTQKPAAVIDAVSAYYREGNANIHRGVHYLSEHATRAYEDAREKVRRLLNAERCSEIVFVRGTTEGINLVANAWGHANLRSGDEVVLSEMEHHSNIVPWQLVAEQTGAVIRVIPVSDSGELILDEYAKLLTKRTKIVAVTHVSNALGTVNPVRQVVEMAHRTGALALVDGAQAVPHLPVDVREIGCDFYAFSGHKVYGPTGIGALYGRAELLMSMPPWQGGGDMIATVTFAGSTYAAPPARFEAGTPHIAGAVGLGAAIDYVEAVGYDAISAWEHDLVEYATAKLSAVPGLRIIGDAAEKAGVISFVMGCAHPHDIGTILDGEGVAVRTGHHCCQPLMARYGVPATARASFAMYNTREDVDALVNAVQKVREVLG